MWSLAGCLALVAAVSTYQILNPTDARSIAAKLGDFSNRIVRAASKLGMGISSLFHEERPAAGNQAPASRSDLPAGVVVVAAGKPGTPAAHRPQPLPKGMTRDGAPTTLIGKGAEELDHISTAAFIKASKPEAPGK